MFLCYFSVVTIYKLRIKLYLFIKERKKNRGNFIDKFKRISLSLLSRFSLPTFLAIFYHIAKHCDKIDVCQRKKNRPATSFFIYTERKTIGDVNMPVR